MSTSRSILALLLTGAVVGTPTTAFADHKDGHDKKAKSGGASTAGSKDSGVGASDPGGNNGTIKIANVPLDGGHGNEPHVGCTFALRFFGFDDNQTADITFTGHAPTKAGTLLTQKAVPISDDAAGGGKDTDAVLTYTVDQLGLRDVPQAKQGWHVKVAVDVLEAPGGAKQKVFWISCPEAAALGTPGTSGGTGTTAPSSTTPGTSLGGSTAGGGTSVGSTPTTALPGTAVSGSGSGLTLVGGTTSAVGGNSATLGSGSLSLDAVARGALPRTGGAELLDLGVAGLVALGLGGATLRAGRRRTALI